MISYIGRIIESATDPTISPIAIMSTGSILVDRCLIKSSSSCSYILLICLHIMLSEPVRSPIDIISGTIDGKRVLKERNESESAIPRKMSVWDIDHDERYISIGDEGARRSMIGGRV